MASAVTSDWQEGPLAPPPPFCGPSTRAAILAGASKLADFVSRSPMSPPRPEQCGAGDMYISSRGNPDIVQCRLRRMQAFLRRQYPRHTAKLVARDLSADPRTVEGWLATEPQPPSWKHFNAMMDLYEGFVSQVCLQRTPEELAQEALDELQQLRRSLDGAIARAEAALRR